MLAFSAIADAPLADDAEVRFIGVPAASVSVAGIAPDLVGRGLRIFPPASNVVVSVVAPTAVTGASIKPEPGRVTLIKRAPLSVSTGVQIAPNAVTAYDLNWNRPRILTGLFSERRIRFVILRQTGAT
jgi:hypothetical protein